MQDNIILIKIKSINVWNLFWKIYYIDIYEFILLNIFMEEPSNLSEWKNEQILRILCWVKDALFATLSYILWKLVRSYTKSFENSQIMKYTDGVINQVYRETEEKGGCYNKNAWLLGKSSLR